MAFFVAPALRGQGIGRQILRYLETQKELGDVRLLFGGVEPDNLAARRCCEKAGYHVANTPEEEGYLRVEKELQ